MNQPLRIGPYATGELVARDAHASVCRVVDPDDGRTLTAKLYAPTGGPDTRLLSRWHEEFADEARRLRRYGRDLVPIEDSGRAGDLAWVVMDIPSGEFLEDILGEEPLSNDRALALLGSMAAALDRLHAVGLIHRSMKPSNVVIADDGSVRFMDTLLLGRFAEAVVAGALSLDRVICAAPEVVLGYRQRAASNQYSLAVMAYRALTGRWPYAAGNAIDYAYACVYQEAPAPSSRQVGIPPEVDAIIARALAKEPDERYSSCAAFVDELAAVLPEIDPANQIEEANEIEPAHEIEAAAADEDESLPLEWFEPETTVLELVPELLSEPPPPLRAVHEREQVPDLISPPPEVQVADLDDFELRVDGPSEETRASASPAACPDEVELVPDSLAVPPAVVLPAAPPAVVVPEAHELEEFTSAPLNLPARPPVGGRLRRLGAGILNLLGKFVAGAGGRRVPDHLMREAYLAEWRGNAVRPHGVTHEEWSDPITPEWALTVQPAKPGWLRIDGRYSGPAPAEISITGPAGKQVLVELMRDGVAVASTELQLHPLMDKTWEPQEN